MRLREGHRNAGDRSVSADDCPENVRLAKAWEVMLDALKFVRDNWEGNLTEAARRVNEAIEIAEKEVKTNDR